MSQICHTMLTSDNFADDSTVDHFMQMMEPDLSGRF
jgi:hypothetical protein